MSKKLKFVFILLIVLQHLGCQPASKSIPTVKAITKTTPIEFTFPQDWRPNRDKHPYDLQWEDARVQMTTGVFAIRKEDIPEGYSVKGVYQLQIDDIAGKRTNFKVIEAAQTQERDGKRLTKTVYQGDNHGQSYYYIFTLIEFLADDSKFAIVLQVSFPESWEANKTLFEMITNSARAVATTP